MKVGFIGLGKMGTPMVERLLEKKHKVVVYNRSPEKTKKMEKKGIISTYSKEEFCSKLPNQKIIWLMITAGKPVDETIKSLLPHLKKGDILIDGGNSFYEISKKRYSALKKRGINFVDCGVSGGIEGARNGACMMCGGDKNIFKKIEPLLKDLSTKNGYGHMGRSGAGHFVKGIHNGIEYGMLGALNEGFETIESQSKTFKTDMKEVARVFNNGSIIQGRLTNWIYESLKKPKYLNEISCEVPKGDTEEEMKYLEKKFKLPILRQARLMRVQSRKKGTCGRIIAATRNQFGGHKTN